jgi:hypothetical protein
MDYNLPWHKRFSAARVGVVVAALVGVLPAGAGAKTGGLPTLPGLSGDPAGWVEGQWVAYKVSAAGQPDRRVQFAVVGKGEWQGQPGAWLEYEMDGAAGMGGAVKVLVVGDVTAPGAVKRMIFQTAGGPAMELPMQPEGAATESRPLGDPAYDATRLTRVKSEEVKTAAGAFKAEVFTYEAGGLRTQMWRSDKVGLTGLVKVQSEGQTIELVGLGADAKSKVTGEPVNLARRMQEALAAQRAAEGK